MVKDNKLLLNESFSSEKDDLRNESLDEFNTRRSRLISTARYETGKA